MSPQDPSKPTVLVVEDHAPNILVARLFLEDFGYDADVVTNGLDAIERLKRQRYHAVLMDVQMPDMNGYDVTRMVREFEKETQSPHQRIIGMTAHALTGDRERCIASGMDDYLTKPFDPEVLKQKLAAA